VTVVVEPRCKICGHTSTQHELHPSLIIGACSAVTLANSRCRCTAYLALAQPPDKPNVAKAA
jgi:hypothetical protein